MKERNMDTVWAVVTTPSDNLGSTFAGQWELLPDGRLRIANMLPVSPDGSPIATIKNVASRLATRRHCMAKKGPWKRDLDVAIANDLKDYYIRHGTGPFEDMTLELIIGSNWRIKGNPK